MTTTPTTRDELEIVLGLITGHPYTQEEAQKIGKSFNRRLESHGLRIVPVEATENMVNEVYFSDDLIWERADESKWVGWTDWPRAYKIAISASPFAPTEKE
jgi:hypothetical protein